MSVKKLTIITLCLLLAVTAAGQKRKRQATPKAPAVPYIEQARQALQAYRFDDAQELAEKEIEAARKNKQEATEAEQILQQAEIGQLALHATERIAIIDSVVCQKDEVLTAIKLSSECGRIDTYASTYHTADTKGATIYENDFANKRLLAVETPGRPSALRLAVADKIGDAWTNPILLNGLHENDLNQNFPYMLSDGVTLYYAATGPESMGGYDIFVTRSDGEDGSFLTPENIGFPFNSPANDYLLVIDEVAQLGWFVSDRNQPEGKVCLYTFIPNATRQTYHDIPDETLRSRARIVSIRDTWKDAEKATIDDAKQRLTALRNTTNTRQSDKADFHFVIDNERTYTTLTDFQSPQARQMMQQWIQQSKNLQTDAIMLQRMRDNYATANKTERRKMEEAILRMESTYYPQEQQLKQLEKEIRNAEISRR